jgi:hypothetical protein
VALTENWRELMSPFQGAVSLYRSKRAAILRCPTMSGAGRP